MFAVISKKGIFENELTKRSAVILRNKFLRNGIFAEVIPNDKIPYNFRYISFVYPENPPVPRISKEEVATRFMVNGVI